MIEPDYPWTRATPQWAKTLQAQKKQRRAAEAEHRRAMHRLAVSVALSGGGAGVFMMTIAIVAALANGH